MPIDPAAERFLRMMSAARAAGLIPQSIDERRRALLGLMTPPGRPLAMRDVTDFTCEGPGGPVGIRAYVPLTVRSNPTPGLIYFHGGGLVAGSVETHDGLCRELATGIGCRVLSVEYRLAPEHKFPAPLQDGLAALAWTRAHAAEIGIDPGRIAVGGDSVGGGLAATICRTAGQERKIRLAYQLLICPVLDHAADTYSRRMFDGLVLEGEAMRRDLLLYLPPGVNADNPLVSPLRAPDLASHPPAFIHTAEFDPVRDEGIEYADRLRRRGAVTHHTSHPGMIHLFYGLGRFIPYGRTVLKLIGAQIRAKGH